ncbi:SURF1 family protein [Streptomyces sp. SID3343]|uniref:SURF1 family cytochrome oxidase biogenesis protein n=1 Tax=Streptomyces sp. SID3343 TaxID=2690260 RepID=UPI00137081D2|nr:SURF1 family protein [Streptomyces sp. SID3343]
MYRFLLQPRWLVFHVIVLVAVPVCAALGLWQFHRYGEHKASGDTGEKVSAAPAVPLGELVPVGGKVETGDRGRAVTVAGSYDAARQVVVPGRRLDGRTGSYVVTPLIVPGGAAVVVNRGWVAGTNVPAPPVGPVTVTGRLEWSEAEHTSDADRATDLRAGQISMISTAELVNVVPYPLTDGFVALTTQTPPADSAALAPMPPVKDAAGGGMSGRAWQNLGYTAQWFVFAGAAVFLWWRVVRREAEEREEAREAEVLAELGVTT